MNKRRSFGLVAFGLLACGVQISCKHSGTKPSVAEAAPQLPLIPWPAQLVLQDKRYVFDGIGVATPANAVLKDVGLLLTQELKTFGNAASVRNATVALVVSNSVSNDEGYTLQTSAAGVVISARSAAGAFRGTRTLLQLIERKGTQVVLPAVQIQDEPRFAFRGMHLDVSRHFFSVDEVKRFLDLLASYKLNVFHWHLTDDQGWRLPVAKRPLLTKIGGFREDHRHELFSLPMDQRPPVPASQAPYGGFYTEEQIRDVVAYAAARHMTIIPEVDMPGHAQAALAAYPELSCVPGAKYKVAPGGVFPFSDPLCPCKPETFAFVKDVLDAMASLFPGPFIHIGGDEVETSSWKKLPACAALKTSQGFTNDRQLEAYFIKKVAVMVRDVGKTPMYWEEAVEVDGPPSQGVSMAWKSAEPAGKVARQGHKAVVVDSTALYFDFTNDAAGPGLAGLKKVYTYEPMPAGLSVEQERNILGIEAALWTENLQTMASLERAILPRLLAAGELAWTPRTALSWPAFVGRTLQQMPKLASTGYTVFIPTPVGLQPHRAFAERLKVEIASPATAVEVRYTTDGKEPTFNSTLAQGPLVISETTTIKARSFLSLSPQLQSDIVVAKFEKQTLATPVPPGSRKSGLHYEYLEGRAFTVSGVSKLKASSQGTLAQPSVPDIYAKSTQFALVFLGVVTVQETGIHTFCVASNDGSKLLVAGKEVVDNDGIHGLQKRCGEVALAKGTHNFELKYFQDGGGTALAVTHAFGDANDVALPDEAYSYAP